MYIGMCKGRNQLAQAGGTGLTLQLLYSGGSGEKYHVSSSYRPSSILSTFFTLVNSSCCLSSLGSKSPWCSSSNSSPALRFFDLHTTMSSNSPSSFPLLNFISLCAKVLQVPCWLSLSHLLLMRLPVMHFFHHYQCHRPSSSARHLCMPCLLDAHISLGTGWGLAQHGSRRF